MGKGQDNFGLYFAPGLMTDLLGVAGADETVADTVEVALLGEEELGDDC